MMSDLNMQPTTTASMFCATDLLSPVVKLLPKPALSGSNEGGGGKGMGDERARITRGVRRCGLVENIYRQLKEKTPSPKITTTGRGGGERKGQTKTKGP